MKKSYKNIFFVKIKWFCEKKLKIYFFVKNLCFCEKSCVWWKILKFYWKCEKKINKRVINILEKKNFGEKVALKNFKGEKNY